MALVLKSVAKLKPEIQLAQAISEFEAILSDNEKARLRLLKSNTAPNPEDVIRVTAEIDRSSIAVGVLGLVSLMYCEQSRCLPLWEMS